MSNGGAVSVTVWNAYGNGCGTPWLWGPNNFQQGDTFIATDCNGYIMPNKVYCAVRISVCLMKMTSS
jgi:hypothetical protein